MCYIPLISGRTSAATKILLRYVYPLCVPDVSGGLKIWLDTDIDVTVSGTGVAGISKGTSTTKF